LTVPSGASTANAGPHASIPAAIKPRPNADFVRRTKARDLESRKVGFVGKVGSW
jgi:hypothetical protein